MQVPLQITFRNMETSEALESYIRGRAEKLDSICMQLIAIGEGLKNLDKVTHDFLLPRYPQVE